MIKFVKINDVVVKPMKTPDDLDKRPPRGQKMFDIAYSNIYACSKKKTGKSSVVAEIVSKCAGPTTQVHIFCSTVHIDPTYRALVEYLEDKGIACYESTSIKDDEGFDLVDDILKEDEAFMDPETKEAKPETNILNLDEKPKKKKKKSKFKELRRIFVFDDLANEIRDSKSLKKLLKTNRHYFYKTIIASQYVNDLPPQSINQLDYVLLFKCHNDDKLTEIHKKLDLSIPLPTFLHIYKMCTHDKTKFNFLWMDRFDNFRKDFNQKIVLKTKYIKNIF